MEYPKTAPEIISIEGIAPFPEVTKLNKGDVVPLTIRIRVNSATPLQKPLLINPLDIDMIQSNEAVIGGSRFLGHFF